jgi:hydrogenase maturation protease
MAQPQQLVLGLGNPLAGDDGFGRAVIERLRARPELAGAADVRDAGTDLLAHIETFGTYQEVVLVDAVIGAGPAGEVAVLDEATFTAWPGTSASCHEISPVLAIKLFRRLHPEAATRIALVALHGDTLRAGAVVADDAVARGADAVMRLLGR